MSTKEFRDPDCEQTRYDVLTCPYCTSTECTPLKAAESHCVIMTRCHACNRRFEASVIVTEHYVSYKLPEETATQLKPLNGETTHPLSEKAVAQLWALAEAPQPRLEINPGLMNRLLREDLVKVTSKASPYRIHKGRNISWVCLTPLGRARLAALNT